MKNFNKKIKPLLLPFWLCICLTLITASSASAGRLLADIEITGKVIDAKGEPVPGVSVLIKGTQKGAITDLDGAYKITAPDNGTLVFSFVGYATVEEVINGRTKIDATLKEDAKQLEGVVVTALGIKRKEKSLTYSNQNLSGNELTTAKDPNMMNSLSGKMAGVTITKSASGAGGSAKVVLRGNRSASGNNQPLYVVDGVPISNGGEATGTSNAKPFGGDNDSPGRDAGDGISNINPDDVESVTVLKGASAAALYGSQAANGVIIITTKKGKAGATKIDFSSNYTFDKVVALPEFQSKYGQTAPGARDSWGGQQAGVDNVSNFFQTGSTWINSLSLSGGNEKFQTYFSYANTSSEGVVPTSKFKKNNFTLRESGKFLNNKLSVDGSINVIQQKSEGRPNPGGLYFNALTGLYLLPRSIDITPYKDNFEKYDVTRNLMAQNWEFVDDMQQNPYWILHRNTTENSRTRGIGSLTAKYDFTDWLFIQLRGTVDKSLDKLENKMYATSSATLVPSNGRYIINNTNQTQTYGDLIVSANKTFDKIGLGLTLGTSTTENTQDGQLIDSYQANLYFANFFDVSNIRKAGNPSITTNAGKKQLQSVFGTAQLAFDEKVYIDITGRNDWSSALAYTPNGSYFYPSVGLTAVLSELFKFPEAISFAKIRASYASVGNDVPIYLTHPLNTISNAGALKFNTEKPFVDLKPERTKSFEVGTDWRFFANRLTLDATYYKTNTTDQFFRLAAPPGSGYSWYYVNAGNIQNEGAEVMLGIKPVQKEDFSWDVSFNYSTNVNKIITLSKEIKNFLLTDGGNTGYSLQLKEGGSFGDIYSYTTLKAPDGSIYVDSLGSPLKTDTMSKVGNPNPKYTLGLKNTFTYKSFYLSFLVDGRFGGEVMSMTQAIMDQYGVSKVSGDARDAGGVDVKATVKKTGQPYVGKLPAKAYYTAIGRRDGVLSEYMYSATAVRLRELAIGYTFPKTLVGEDKTIKGITISLVARNLFYIYKDAPFDPEQTASTGNGLQGIDIFGLPATRSIGFNVKFSF